MRTSLTETAQIENWLLKRGEPAEQLVLEAKMLSNPEMREKVKWQQMAYEVVRLHGRQQLKEEIKAIEHQVFNTTRYRSFQDRIRSIFKS